VAKRLTMLSWWRALSSKPPASHFTHSSC
jgi:hypothetical protein